MVSKSKIQMTTIPTSYRQEPNGSCYLINPPAFDYSAPYWGKNGRSTLEEQRFNVHGFQNENGMTKSENVLLHCVGTSILEIGCAPGSFLRYAVEQGFECMGIAPEKGLSSVINAHCGCPVVEGFFPDAIKDSDKLFDNVVAMDVMEHILDGKGFVENCMKRLNPNGRLILMIPMLTDEDEFRPQDFCDEHVVIYHKKHLEEWLKPIVFDTWLTGHTILVIEKKVNFREVLENVIEKLVVDDLKKDTETLPIVTSGFLQTDRDKSGEVIESITTSSAYTKDDAEEAKLP